MGWEKSKFQKMLQRVYKLDVEPHSSVIRNTEPLWRVFHCQPVLMGRRSIIYPAQTNCHVRGWVSVPPPDPCLLPSLWLHLARLLPQELFPETEM